MNQRLRDAEEKQRSGKYVPPSVRSGVSTIGNSMDRKGNVLI